MCELHFSGTLPLTLQVPGTRHQGSLTGKVSHQPGEEAICEQQLLLSTEKASESEKANQSRVVAYKATSPQGILA